MKMKYWILILIVSLAVLCSVGCTKVSISTAITDTGLLKGINDRFFYPDRAYALRVDITQRIGIKLARQNSEWRVERVVIVEDRDNVYTGYILFYSSAGAFGWRRQTPLDVFLRSDDTYEIVYSMPQNLRST